MNITGVKEFTCLGALGKLNFRQDKHIFSPNVQQASEKLQCKAIFH